MKLYNTLLLINGDRPCVSRMIAQLQDRISADQRDVNADLCNKCATAGRGASAIKELCISLLGALPLSFPQGLLRRRVFDSFLLSDKTRKTRSISLWGISGCLPKQISNTVVGGWKLTANKQEKEFIYIRHSTESVLVNSDNNIFSRIWSISYSGIGIGTTLIYSIIILMLSKWNSALVLLPVHICLIKALFVVSRFQKVTLNDPNDTNTFVVCLRRRKIDVNTIL